MHITLDIYNADKYFEQQSREIDYDKTGDENLVSYDQSQHIDRILTSEAAIYALRRATGTDGYQTDMMVEMRRKLIDDYEKTYNEEYVSHNDFY